MRIQKDDQICGHPAMNVRKLMRHWQGPIAGLATIQKVLGVPDQEAASLLAALVAEGLIEQDDLLSRDERTYYRLTLKGAALAQASAAKPIHRAVARTRLHELIGRMCTVNEDPRFYVGLEEAAVFGSYLTNAERLGDLDVSCKFYRKIEDQATFRTVTQRAAIDSARSFSNIVEEAYWPWQHVILFLKNRSRVYSIKNNEGLLDDPTVPRLVIFKDRKPVANWHDL